MIGGTADNGLGAALLYPAPGSDWREHSATKIDDVMLKSRCCPTRCTPSTACCNTTKAKRTCRAA